MTHSATAMDPVTMPAVAWHPPVNACGFSLILFLADTPRQMAIGPRSEDNANKEETDNAANHRGHGFAAHIHWGTTASIVLVSHGNARLGWIVSGHDDE
jgi:hypothetical protein